MKQCRVNCRWLVVALFLFIPFWASLLSPAVGAPASEEEEARKQQCRRNLQTLGQALRMYLIYNEKKLPARISELYTNGFVLDLDVFSCRSTGARITDEKKIDELTDFVLATKITEERPLLLIKEKSADASGRVLALYSDRSVREIEASGTQLAKTEPAETEQAKTGQVETEQAKTGTDEETSESPPAEKEPNNKRETASAVEIGKTLKANIQPKGDADWYRLEVDHQGALNVKFGKVPSDLNMYFRVVRIVDSKEEQIQGWAGTPKAGAVTERAVDLPAKGAYYLEVRDGGNNAQSSEPYEMSLAFTATADASEPNNKMETASAVEIGKTVKANILPKGDADWYRVDVEHQGELNVKFGKVPSNLDMYFRVVRFVDSKEDQIQGWVGPPRAGAPNERAVDLPAKGAYYLEVRDGGNNARSPEPYELSLAFTPTADDGEPNNKMETASPIAVGKVMKANILPKGDADWYWLPVGHQGALQVKFSNPPPNLDMYFRVVRFVDSKEDQIQGWVGPPRAGAPNERVVDLPARGSYYLEVRDGGNNARSSAPYELTLAFTATADDGEPNNSRETASPIAVGKPVQANILPRNDADWYRLEVERQGELQVKFGEVPSNLNMYFRVVRFVDSKEDQIHSWVGPPRQGAVTEKVIKLPTAGTYYLEVRDGGNNASSGQPYTLSVSRGTNQ
ncbi:MAG: PPC domain-containing protein [Nitrospinota bacterium]